MEATDISFSYINSSDAVEIDNGIRNTITGIRFSILAMGIALAKIKQKRLYQQLNCKTLGRYIKRLCEDFKMDRTGIYGWLYMGQAYLKHQNELETIGFTENDSPYKLKFLEKAIANNRKQEVFDNIKTMTVREFMNFAKKKTEDVSYPDDKWTVSKKGNSIYVNGQLAVIISTKTDPRISRYFKKIIYISCKAIEAGGSTAWVFFQNRRDARHFCHVVDDFKQKMGFR
jgi:hypothetical protein